MRYPKPLCGLAVIHPALFAVKSKHMHHLKAKPPYGSNIAIAQFLPQIGRGYYSRAAIHPARKRAGILAGE